MTLLGSPTAVHDKRCPLHSRNFSLRMGPFTECMGEQACIVDVEAFVRATVSPRLNLTPDERDELVAEGIRKVLEMAETYEPGHGGQDPTTSRLNGYVAKFLPGKLSDSFHRLNEHHRLENTPEGRRWTSAPRPASLDAMTAEDPEGADHIRTLHTEDAHDDDLAVRLRVWWEERARYEGEMFVQTSVLISQGFKLSEIRDRLRIDDSQAHASYRLVQLLAADMLSEQAA